MNAHVSSILLGVRDMDRSERFCTEGLGWKGQRDYGISVFFEPNGGSLVGFPARREGRWRERLDRASGCVRQLRRRRPGAAGRGPSRPPYTPEKLWRAIQGASRRSLGAVPEGQCMRGPRRHATTCDERRSTIASQLPLRLDLRPAGGVDQPAGPRRIVWNRSPRAG